VATTERPQVECVTLGDVDVAYRRAGTGRRLVLIHGLAQDLAMWEQIQSAWTQCETYAYDLRGHGGTSIGEAQGTIDQFGRDLVAFLEFVGPAVCVGFSLGGSVALWAAAERPDLVKAVIAVATSSVVGRAAAESMDGRIAQLVGGDADMLREMIESDTRSQLAHADADLATIVEGRLAAIGDGSGYLNGARAVRSMHDEPLNDRLDTIMQPVLVLSGSVDPWCPRRAAEIMLEHLAHAEFVELPGVGHLVMDVAEPEFLSAARPWVERLGVA